MDARVVIAIPTYRRPESLRRLLRAIVTQDFTGRIIVIVADNDPERQEGLAVCDVARNQGYPFELVSLVSPERGISSTRNVLVSAAMELADIVCIAMLDDDEWPDAHWLSALMKTRSKTQADIIAGPVRSIYALPVPDYVARNNKPLTDRPEGLTDFINSTSNILFNRQVFVDSNNPWFDPMYALIGGGDKEFLYRVKQQGKRFAWSQQAWVNEEMPASRSTMDWALKRAYRVGNSDMFLKLRHDGRSKAMLGEGVKIALGWAGGGLLSAPLLPPRIQFLGKRTRARARGKIAAIRGNLYEEYAILHGS